MKDKQKLKPASVGKLRNHPHYKDMPQERGITLVALIITIIILVILAAVTIKAVFDSNFLETATKGTENYAEAQSKEIEEFNNIDSFIKEKIKDIESNKPSENEPSEPNKTPVFKELPKSVEREKTNEKVKLVMTAEDANGDNLTYTIKYGMYNEDGTKGLVIDTKTIENAPQGVEQNIEITGLSNYTNYYFDVTASDGTASDTKTIDIKTYCLGIACPGPTQGLVDCETCERKGNSTSSLYK